MKCLALLIALAFVVQTPLAASAEFGRGGGGGGGRSGGGGGRGGGGRSAAPAQRPSGGGGFNLSQDTRRPSQPAQRPSQPAQRPSQPAQRPSQPTQHPTNNGNRTNVNGGNKTNVNTGNKTNVNNNTVNRNTNVNVNNYNRTVIANPIYRGPAWGWNRGVAWAPAYGYYGGGFWGPFAVGVTSAVVFGAIVNSSNQTMTSYQVQPSSPGATLLSNYQLTQTQCGPPNLVVVYGPNNSVMCAYPNNLVSAGTYSIDTSTLSLTSS